MQTPAVNLEDQRRSDGDGWRAWQRRSRAHISLASLAIGLAIRACQAGHRVLFATASQWVDRLADAHRQGRLQPELVRLGRYPLLVVDEVGYIRLVH
jgi:hypothetical protein